MEQVSKYGVWVPRTDVKTACASLHIATSWTDTCWNGYLQTAPAELNAWQIRYLLWRSDRPTNALLFWLQNRRSFIFSTSNSHGVTLILILSFHLHWYFLSVHFLWDFQVRMLRSFVPHAYCMYGHSQDS